MLLLLATIVAEEFSPYMGALVLLYLETNHQEGSSRRRRVAIRLRMRFQEV